MPALLIRNGALPVEFLAEDTGYGTSPHPSLHPPQTGEGWGIPYSSFAPGDLLLQGERIAAVHTPETGEQNPARRHRLTPAPGADHDLRILDASGCIVLPGFVDVHVHGAVGADTMDATAEGLAEMARFFARHGVTAFLPTTMTAPFSDIRRAVAAVANAGWRMVDGKWQMSGLPPEGARVLGVHLEGPYISPQFPGAQPAAFIRPPSLEEFHTLLTTGPIRMITLAPEASEAEALIRTARAHNVVAVMGHTNATYEECKAAISWGASQATHTYNAMRGLHHRRPGTLGAVLSHDEIDAQLIADNIHVHPAAMKILARCKSIAHTLLITDAMRAAGMPPGVYDLGGQLVTVADGQCLLPDGVLAGSLLTMERALANFMAATGLSLAEVWPASSRTPARTLGLDGEIGSLSPGFRADLVLLNYRLEVEATLVGGAPVYLREPARMAG
jgi:N-acetylglucosamine-6-phosphate deacetylase